MHLIYVRVPVPGVPGWPRPVTPLGLPPPTPGDAPVAVPVKPTVPFVPAELDPVVAVMGMVAAGASALGLVEELAGAGAGAPSDSGLAVTKGGVEELVAVGGGL